MGVGLAVTVAGVDGEIGGVVVFVVVHEAAGGGRKGNERVFSKAGPEWMIVSVGGVFGVFWRAAAGD